MTMRVRASSAGHPRLRLQNTAFCMMLKIGALIQNSRVSDTMADAASRFASGGWVIPMGLNNFIADVGLRPSAAFSLDRINVNGDYEPGNVRWATRNEQAQNKRTTLHLTLNGRTQTVFEWGRELNIKPVVLQKRHRLGWTDEEALSTPINSHARRAQSGLKFAMKRWSSASKFTDESVLFARHLRAQGQRFASIQRLLLEKLGVDVTPEAVRDAVLGLTWKSSTD